MSKRFPLLQNRIEIQIGQRALLFTDRVTSRLVVYRQSVRLGDKPLETHDRRLTRSTEHLLL
jgi:hypothetical protein